MNNKKMLRIISLIACLAFLLGMAGAQPVAAEDNTAGLAGPPPEIIDEVVDFLEEMDMGDMAANIRKWMDDKKIKISPDLKSPGSTTVKGVILLNKRYQAPLPEDEYERFEVLSNLAAVLYHEKIHVHQAPLGNALSEGVDKMDWLASEDVMKECVGPDPLEVDAYYKQLRALLKWWQKIDSQEIPDSLSESEKEEAEADKEDKKSFLLGQFDFGVYVLKEGNYEKASKFKDLEYLMDLYQAIADTEGLSEKDMIQQAVELLDSLIDKLFDPDGFYDKCRKLYAAKKGNNKTSLVVPAEPGSTEEYVFDLPESNGYISIAGLPDDLDIGENEMLEIAVTQFMIPPDPDAGYRIMSPVYEISWNSYSPIPFDITIYTEGLTSPDMKIKAFAMTKLKVESAWSDLETELFSEGDFNIMTASSDTATMFAVIAPEMSFIDMPPIHWAFDSSARLESAGILREGAILYPNMDVPREMFVEYLVKALDLELITEAVPFTDIDEENPYFAYISTAYHNGLTSGVAADRFGMGEIIPREQSITFLIRALGMEEDAIQMPSDEISGYLDKFTDITSNCSEWAYPYLAQAVKILMVEGYPDNTLRGKNLLSHAEVIALIDRIMVHLIYHAR